MNVNNRIFHMNMRMAWRTQGSVWFNIRIWILEPLRFWLSRQSYYKEFSWTAAKTFVLTLKQEYNLNFAHIGGQAELSVSLPELKQHVLSANGQWVAVLIFENGSALMMRVHSPH